MGVVQLNRPVTVELGYRTAAQPMQPEHVLQRAGGEKILLLEAKPFAAQLFVVGIQDLGDVLGGDLLLDRAVVVAAVEGLEVERFVRFSSPQAQQVYPWHPVAEDRRIVRDSPDDSIGNPFGARHPRLASAGLDPAAEADVVKVLRPHYFPRIAAAQPFVGLLHLPSVTNLLAEDAELVTNAVADRRHFQSRQRIHVAGSQAPQAAIAEPRLLLLPDQILKILPEL